MQKNSRYDRDLAIKFVIRRAFRYGAVKRSDIVLAFKISVASASRVMESALTQYSSIIEKRSTAIVPVRQAVPPAFASESDLISNLEGDSYTSTQKTGLFSKDLHVSTVEWRNPLPAISGDLTKIVKAIANEIPIRVKYVGLRKGEVAKWRFLAPIGLEKVGDQWRLLANDLESPSFEMKSYVLPRILGVEIDNNDKVPKKFRWMYPGDRAEKVKVQLNGELTKDQVSAISNELNIKDSIIEIPSRSLFEAESRYAEKKSGSNVVWPLAVKLEKVSK